MTIYDSEYGQHEPLWSSYDQPGMNLSFSWQSMINLCLYGYLGIPGNHSYCFC